VEAVRLLRRGELSPLELVEASAARIAATDPHLNALPTLCLERARDQARRIMREGRDRERPAAWLGGLPIAVKDLNAVAGVRTTYGSRIYADHVPKSSDWLVERLEARGAIVMGKSNTPEFGAGANTFNEVFGQTRNPWNLGKSVAGSSGGSAAAVASGQVWLATGTDLGGSLRTPASFNAVVGLRPGPGRVVRGSPQLAFDTLNVEGPIARSAADAALLLDAMAGPHRAEPLSRDAPAVSFVEAVRAAPAPRRVAFSPQLNITPVDPEVARICAAASHRLAEMGTELDDACPDFTGAFDTFQVLRAAWFAGEHEAELRDHRDLLKPEIVGEIEKGLAISAGDIARAERERTRLYRNVVAFFDDHDLLLCPTAIVPPFDVDQRYVEEVNGQRFANYVQWTSITSAITLTSCPAASVPVGFTHEGLPVGLQVIGPPHEEARVLAAAARLERVVDVVGRLPVDPEPSRSGKGTRATT
jgi:amidase